MQTITRFACTGCLTLLVMGLATAARGAEDGGRQAAAGSADDFRGLRTFGTAGKQLQPLTADAEGELFRHEGGPGCLTHMWFGGAFAGYERTRIRIYVDGEEKPSIEMELGMGHGVGFSDPAAPWGIARFGKTGNPSGIYDTYRIPFGHSIRVTGQLGSGVAGKPDFWWIVRGSEGLRASIGGVRLPASARLRLYKREDYLAKPLEEFALCNVEGDGALYEVTMAAKGLRKGTDPKRQWMDLSYMEGCMRAYIGGKKSPLLLSSGLEDYFLGTYYFNRGRYYTPVAGLTHLDAKENEFSAYRFHDDDPVFFSNGLKLTARCGDTVGGEMSGGKPIGDPPETRYTSYVWLYQW